ncbi:hypothetical protein P167DRAFT_159745 [Morchella conica CCBAS932]|uniref:PH domain-containing protein n=1 Tax=Morchella conica CCBAS932 TaxID=1392247 RepID=A0A3N4KQ08_9PEZI|nr:hypothetical protein P167DRAFT_159745 [Morchella conica CCBAS932]
MTMIETETRQPVAAPPSRYRTIRRKLANTPTAATVEAPAAPIAQSSSSKYESNHNHHNSSSHPSNATSQPMTRQPSKFRQILRLNTKEVSPPPAPIPQSAPAALPRPNKLTKSHSQSPPKKVYTKRDEIIDQTLEKLMGSSATEKYSPYNELNYDFKVPCHLDTGVVEQMGTCNTTDADMFLKRARPRKERILLESWPTLGLQRQIRHFELISDVVATWDPENTRCHLRVEKWAWGQTNLNVKEFPKEEPASGVAQFHYYNNAEKKWSRRWIRLGNGSVRIAKKDRPTEKDFTQTIALESFDAYTFSDPHHPSERLRCPTKYCFALKSQHQLSLFGEGAVYCHYFAAENEAQMAEWFSLIRDFKSRLIAEKRDLAWWTAVESDSDARSSSAKTASPAGSPGRGRHRQKPLISPEELAQPPAATGMQRGKSVRHDKSITRSNTRRHRSPSARSPKAPETHSDDGGVFSPGGLLGSDYEDKRRIAQMAFKEERSQPHNEFTLNAQAQAPPPPGHHQPLVNTSSSSSKPLQRAGTVVSRPSTAHKQAGTLLNFHQEEPVPALPHHSRRGRGHTVSGQDSKSKGGLISLVKSDLPPIPTYQMSSHTKRPNTGKGRNHRGESDDEQTAFTGTGLLSHGYHSAGATTMGHGVANGRDAIGKNGEITPLLGAGQKSMFAPGSLLEKRERELGPARPIIDRDTHSSDDE